MSSLDDSNDHTQSHIRLTKDTLIGHYRIIEKIGAGGMGEVYLAQDTTLDRNVALKFLPPGLCLDPDCRARFKREAQAAAKLDHPNIVSVFEVGDFQGRPYFSMQHVEGRSLKETLRDKLLPLDPIVELGIQMCDALQSAHEHGIIHRDIKPSNILIDSHGRARLVDFGLASVMGSDQLTRTGSTIGTVGYMSPEQVRGEKVDHRTDLFSFGVVLFEMITGHPPFKADSDVATLNAITSAKPDLLARYRREVPNELQTIIDKALDKDLATRYQHADDLAADLRRLATTSAALSQPHRDWWNRYVVTSAAAVLLVVAGYWLVNEYILKTGQHPETGRKMVAVLPFENLGSPDDEYFADGITEEITTNLASLSGLGVISRTSSMQYKKTGKNLKQIGKELGVDYVLEGTIRWEKAGSDSRVRISSQLIRVADDSHLWAKPFDAVLTDVFQVQSTIAHEVASALDVTLLQAERQLLDRKLDVDPRAHDYYLRGKQYFAVARYQQKEMILAEKMHLKAIELAPDFAPAYAEMGSLYTEMYWDQTDHTQRRLDSAKKMVDIAMRLAPNAAESHEALGWYYYHGLRDFERALAEFSKVLLIQPNNTLAMASIAWVQRRQGKWADAIAGLELVNKLDPRDPWYKYELAQTYQPCRRYQDAIRQYDDAIDLQPNLTWAYLLKSFSLFNQLGRTREARAALEAGQAINGRWPELTWLEVYYDLCDKDYNRALSLLRAPGDVLSPEFADTSDYYEMKGLTYRCLGETALARIYYDSARMRLERSLEALPNSAALQSSLAIAYAGLGQSEQAVRLARSASERLPVSADALTGPVYISTLALVYALVGEQDKAIEQLSYLMSIPSNMSVPLLKLLPELDSLRDNPRFQELITEYEQQHGA